MHLHIADAIRPGHPRAGGGEYFPPKGQEVAILWVLPLLAFDSTQSHLQTRILVQDFFCVKAPLVLPIPELVGVVAACAVKPVDTILRRRTIPGLRGFRGPHFQLLFL